MIPFKNQILEVDKEKQRDRCMNAPGGYNEIFYHALDKNGRATGAEACLRGGPVAEEYLDNGTRVAPPGYDSDKGMHKSHLIARRFGGSNEARENMVALYSRANLSGMKKFENAVAQGSERRPFRLLPSSAGV
ncbi:DNA/RNA non-specific endonuclease [Kribbella sp. NPDC051936]|uniref:DNA/RNA non-specific endonuclease n=1 Tax=Kribbella sp. NPDC051936 TaxID=3154946 RepID=UPI0034194DE6